MEQVEEGEEDEECNSNKGAFPFNKGYKRMNSAIQQPIINKQTKPVIIDSSKKLYYVELRNPTLHHEPTEHSDVYKKVWNV